MPEILDFDQLDAWVSGLRPSIDSCAAEVYSVKGRLKDARRHTFERRIR
jgi:hypothetical protein